MKRKTLYEVLEVSPEASYPEIRSACLRLSQQLQSGKSGLSPEDAETKLKVIKQAYETLSDNAGRAAYDAKLAALDAPTQVDRPIRAEVAIDVPGWTPMKILLIVIAGLMAVGSIIQIGFMLLAYRQTQRIVGDTPYGTSAEAKAREKVILQEYYQTTGIKAGSKEEVDLIKADAARQEQERRRAENERLEQERKYRQFVEESRRTGQEVSANLQRAEEAEKRAQEYKQRQLEEQERREKQAELARIENEKNKWRYRYYRNLDN